MTNEVRTIIKRPNPLAESVVFMTFDQANGGRREDVRVMFAPVKHQQKRGLQKRSAERIIWVPRPDDRPQIRPSSPLPPLELLRKLGSEKLRAEAKQ